MCRVNWDIVLHDVERFIASNGVDKTKITPYGERFFDRIRASMGLAEENMNQSINKIEASFKFPHKVSKSRATFALTHDSRFIIKSIDEESFSTMMTLLPELAHYFESNKDSLIARMVGAYGHSAGVLIVVMENVLDNLENVHEKYDLKGSIVGREMRTNPLLGKCMKDLDLKTSILLPQRARDEAITAIRKDVSFLKECGLLDYSLLVGIEYKKIRVIENESFSRSKTRGHEIIPYYAFGIVDILTTFTFRKKFEIRCKTWFCCHNRSDISAMNPEEYASRFIDRMEFNFSEGEGDKIYYDTMSDNILSASTSLVVN